MAHPDLGDFGAAPQRSPAAGGLLPSELVQPGLSPRQVWAILVARKAWIVGVALVVVMLTGVVSKLLPKTYEATATVLINYGANDPFTGRELPSFLAASYLATQVDLLDSPQILLEAVERLGWAQDPARVAGFEGWEGGLQDYLADQLRRDLEVRTHQDSRLINVTYGARDRETAARVANMVVQVYLDRHGGFSRLNTRLVESLKAQLVALETKMASLSKNVGPRHPERLAVAGEMASVRARLEAELNVDKIRAGSGQRAPTAAYDPGPTGGEEQYTNAKLISAATPPLLHSRPKTLLNVILACAVGGFLGVATALLREFMNRRVRCREDLERDLGLVVLAELGPPRDEPRSGT